MDAVNLMRYRDSGFLPYLGTGRAVRKAEAESAKRRQPKKPRRPVSSPQTAASSSLDWRGLREARKQKDALRLRRALRSAKNRDIVNFIEILEKLSLSSIKNML